MQEKMSQNMRMSYDARYGGAYEQYSGRVEEKGVFGRITDGLLGLLTNESPEQPISLSQVRERNPHQHHQQTAVANTLPQVQSRLKQTAAEPQQATAQPQETLALSGGYQPITIPAQSQNQNQIQPQAYPHTGYTAPQAGSVQPPQNDMFQRYLQDGPTRQTPQQQVIQQPAPQSGNPPVWGLPAQGHPAGQGQTPPNRQPQQTGQALGQPDQTFNPFFQVQPAFPTQGGRFLYPQNLE